MSGGHFGYDQYRIDRIFDSVEELIRSNNDTTKNEWGDRKGRGYSAETIAEFKKGLYALRVAQIYAQRIDWLVSCDDSEDNFYDRLKSDLSEAAQALRWLHYAGELGKRPSA